MLENVFTDYNNAQVAALPKYLRRYIVPQHYAHYTPVDHAVWRYVMRQNYSYLKDIAYYPYIPGLEKAGLTIEKIPSLQEMNDALGKIGWGAVTVDGFIPPAAFMEYQAYRVLVIAADIRQLKHIDYTPAPDIIHESAGHAPIIADKSYQEYLSYFGSIGAKAMYSAQDYELYEAIRALSILKEMPDAKTSEIRTAEQELERCQQNMGEPSEMALLSRLHWWTVEYGLIGTLEHPKIYGAGLLSSIGESANCMSAAVKKLWYSIDALNYPYDITRPQPQLFVTPNFKNLIKVLEQFADTMSFRIGGSQGVQKAIECKNVCTVVYSSGLQVSGVFTAFFEGEGKQPSFIKTSGPSALAFGGRQLAGHGKKYHRDGFSSPVGRLKGFHKSLEDFSEPQFESVGIVVGQRAELTFESGITLKGKVRDRYTEGFKTLLITFEDCTVNAADGELLFHPAWGVYDMAVGEAIVSVYSGAADKDAFDDAVYEPKTHTFHPRYDGKTLALHQLYQQVRNCRQSQNNYELLPQIYLTLKNDYPADWLCPLEILEILEQHQLYADTAADIRAVLQITIQQQPQLQKLITDGLYLITHPVEQRMPSV